MDGEPFKSKDVRWVTTEPKNGVARIYTNYLEVASTLYDVRLTLSEVVRVEDDTITLERQATVSMAWAEAKGLSEKLRKKVEDYERTNGRIRDCWADDEQLQPSRKRSADVVQ